jgi:hypothetical protein
MADFYLAHAIGVKDGTKTPPDKFDGRFVGAAKKVVVANHPAGIAYANADQIFLCSLKAGEQITDIKIVTDTTLGTTTLSIGPKTATTKYANAKTQTVVDTPTSLGPKATAADDGPLAADEDVWITLGVGGIAGAILFTITVEIASAAF